ncbi:MAG: pseudaminic acid synthase [Chromatiaceae bacterium]|jgi:N-acetylneuraminate synthase
MPNVLDHYPVIELAGRPCGSGHPPLLVAELSGNHAGRIDNALALIDAAADAGADLIKIQTYRPDTITIDHDGPGFRIETGLWRGRTLYELYQEAHTPWEWHAALFAHARERGVPLFSSPFDPSAVDLLESLDCPIYKIASFELVDVGLIARVAATGKPMILSTGMATPGEIDEALATIRACTDVPVVLMHCTSSYPTPLDQADLNTLPAMIQRHHTPVGLSDHTQGIAAPIAAVALGATMVEKHLTLGRADGSVDAAFSLEPAEFRAMAVACREAWSALGQVRQGPTAAEAAERENRRSLYAVADIAAGERLTPANVRSIRPGLGLHPRELQAVLGRRASGAIAKGTPLAWSLLREPGQEA